MLPFSFCNSYHTSMHTVKSKKLIALLILGLICLGLADSLPLSISQASTQLSDTPQAVVHKAHDKIYPTYAIQIYTLRNAIKKDMASTLGELKKSGYSEVEWGGGYYGKSPAQIRHLLDSIGIKCIGLHTSFGDLKKNLSQVVEDAHTLGSPMIVLPWIDFTQRKNIGDYLELTEFLKKIADTCEKEDLTLLYHNHDFELKEMAGKIPLDVMMKASIGSKLFFEMDIYWVVDGGADPVHFLTQYPDRIKAIHIKDRSEKGKMVDVGDGILPWAKLIPLAKASNVIWPIIEHDDPKDALVTAKKSLDYLMTLSAK